MEKSGWRRLALRPEVLYVCFFRPEAAPRLFGVSLTSLEVTVTSESDVRGMLGVDEAVPSGLQDMCVQVRIAAADCPADKLEELVRWACAHSPVGGSDPANARVIVDVQG